MIPGIDQAYNIAMKILLPLAILLVAAYLGLGQFDQENDSARLAGQSNKALANAYAEGKSDLQIEGKGIVIKLLPDDEDGRRHQRFILSLHTGQTLIVAHNIDVAPRITSLREGDAVAFNGRYEWNPKGGIIHWTHLDPSGRHVAGWLKHKGQIYQ